MRGDAGADPADTLRFFKQQRLSLRNRAAYAAREHRKHKVSSAKAHEAHVKHFYNKEAHIQWAYYRANAGAASALYWSIRKTATEMHRLNAREDTLNKLRAMA